MTGENHIGLYQRDGLTYFAPAKNDQKISNIHKWEQAIYSKANPHRTSEIWQYVYGINTAANSFHWNNVAEYDYTFRQLMSTYPTISWAKTYVKGSNLSMRDALNKSQQSNNNSKSSINNTCWQFNKGKCSDKNCQNGDHHCSYCGKWGHGLFNCRKGKEIKEGNCAVLFRILADRRASSRKTNEIPPVRGTSASLYQFKDQCKLEAESQQSMKMPL